MRIDEITKADLKYSIYREVKHDAMHNSGIPMGVEPMKHLFMKGVPGEHLDAIMKKLHDRLPDQNFIADLEIGEDIDKEEVKEGEERSIIKNACVEKLVDNFAGRENQFQNKEDFEYAIYQQLEDLDVADCVDPEMMVGGQRIGDFASGRVIDCCNSGDIIYDVMANMDLTQIGEDIDKMSMGDTIKDFYKSDAPQFKGKSKKKRRQMAIAAKLSADEK